MQLYCYCLPLTQRKQRTGLSGGECLSTAWTFATISLRENPANRQPTPTTTYPQQINI